MPYIFLSDRPVYGRTRLASRRRKGARTRVGNKPPSVLRSESELERFFDLTLDLLVIAGFDGYMKRLNPAYARTLGYPMQELLARPMLDVVHPRTTWSRYATCSQVSREGTT